MSTGAALPDPGVLPRVPFNRPDLRGCELEHMREAVEQGHTAADGPFTQRVRRVLLDEIGGQEALLTTSCTAALEMSAILLDIEPGDTVVVPSFGFVTTALAFARQGARIIFCDIEPETLGLDPRHLESIMDASVRAVVPIHYAGVACDLTGILEVLDRWPDVALVEDNAHGLFGRYQDAPLGSFGRFSTLSFHETKNFICGEGGALVCNRPDDVDRAHVVYHKGTDRRAFQMGQVDKYTWRDLGSSFGLSDVLAAFLYGQLEERTTILERRRWVFEAYRDALAPEADRLGVALPIVPPDRQQAYHMFYLLLPDRTTRDRVLDGMVERGVHATFHYVPLHSSPGGRRVAAKPTDCPRSEEIAGRLLRLPFSTGLDEPTVDRVVMTFLEVLES